MTASEKRKADFAELVQRYGASEQAVAHAVAQKEAPEYLQRNAIRYHLLAEVLATFNGLVDLYEAQRESGEPPPSPALEAAFRALESAAETFARSPSVWAQTERDAAREDVLIAAIAEGQLFKMPAPTTGSPAPPDYDKLVHRVVALAQDEQREGHECGKVASRPRCTLGHTLASRALDHARRELIATLQALREEAASG